MSGYNFRVGIPLLFSYNTRPAFDMLWYKLSLYQHYERTIVRLYQISTKPYKSVVWFGSTPGASRHPRQRGILLPFGQNLKLKS